MPNPLWVMFPPLRCDARTLMEKVLPGFLAAHRMRPFYAMPITREEDEIVILDGQGQRTDELSQMLAIGRGRLGVSMSFHVQEVRRYFEFIVLDQELPATLFLEIPQEILAENHDSFGIGGWFVSFVASLVKHLDCDLALSTRDTSAEIGSLDVHEVLERVTSGRLLDSSAPVILVLRRGLVSAERLDECVRSRPERGFRLAQAGAHHVLWSMKGAVSGA